MLAALSCALQACIITGMTHVTSSFQLLGWRWNMPMIVMGVVLDDGCKDHA
jgi:uncharacterized integral membrane protein